MDPSFTRMIKLEILTNLALEPKSINDILHEIRTYVRHDDKKFVCAAIQAIGRIAEISKIVYERVIPDKQLAQNQSDAIGFNCLYGLIALTRSSSNTMVIGQCVIVMTHIFSSLQIMNPNKIIQDPNNVKTDVIQRIMFLLVQSLEFIDGKEPDENWNEYGDGHVLPTDAMACSLWLIGEWFISTNTEIWKIDKNEKDQMNQEILRLLTRSFTDFESLVKLQAIHYASKMLLLSNATQYSSLSSHILAQGRLDINPDIRDRARFESSLLSILVPTLLLDFDDTNKSNGKAKPMHAADQTKQLLLSIKPPSTVLPLEKDKNNDKEEVFRFGTLSSLVHHRAGEAYLALPPWATVNSDSSLRDPVKEPHKPLETKQESVRGFYGDDFSNSGSESTSDESSDESTDESSDDDSTSEEDSESSEDESTEESESSESESDSESENETEIENNKITKSFENAQKLKLPSSVTKSMVDESSEDGSASSNETESDESSDDESSDDESLYLPDSNNSLLPMPINVMSKNLTSIPSPSMTSKIVNSPTDDLSGLIMAPLVIDKKEDSKPSDIDSDSGQWYHLVKPELAGGLLLDARYVRGETRKRELNVAGQEINDSVVLVQLKFENR